MAKLLLELLNLSMEYFTLITTLLITLGMILLCSKSIKKKTYIYCIILSIPTLIALVQYVSQLVDHNLDLYKVPIISDVMRINLYMLQLGLPLLLIIMFTGAFKPKSYLFNKLMPIRKELSLLSGFPVLTHALFRVSFTFPHSFSKLFLSPDQPLPEGRIFAEVGYQIGIVMTIIYIVLWVTSFGSVRRKLARGQWKKIHKWSYVLYFLILVHSVLLNTGWIIGGWTPTPPFDKRPIWFIEIVSMLLLYSVYLVLKRRKYASKEADRFSKYF